jgi:hypothetical protein
MARLPDIPIATWAEDQINEFHKATSGYLDSLFFDDQAKQQESGIPPDFDAPGGMDQWQQAAEQRRADELRRQQEEEQRQQEEQRAQQAQQEQAAQVQQAQEAEQARMQREQASAGMLSSLGIPSPEEAFSGFQASSNRPPDHVSSTGILDTRDADLGPHEQPYPGTVTPIQNADGSQTTERTITVTEPEINNGQPTNIPTVWSGRVVSDDEAVRNAVDSRRGFASYPTIDEAVSAAEKRSEDLGTGSISSVGGAQLPTPRPQSPVDQFTSWAQGLTEPLLGKPNIVLSQAPTTEPGPGDVIPPDAAPGPVSPPDHTSTSGIFDTLGQYGQQAIEGIGSAARSAVAPLTDAINPAGMVENVRQGRTPGGQTPSEYVSSFAEQAARMPGEFTNRMLEHGITPFQQEFDRQKELEDEQQAFLGDRATTRQRITGEIDPTWEAANPEKADELRQLREQRALLVGGMAGGGSTPRIADEAIAAIKALRAARIGEDVILTAEQQLAEKLGRPLSAIQELTRGKKFVAATQQAEAGREQYVTSHPDYTAHDVPVQSAAQQEDLTFSALQDAEARFGEGSPQFRQAERDWIDAQATHAEAIQAQEAVRQRLQREVPVGETPSAMAAISPDRAQKAFNAMEEVHATAVTAERDAARRYGPGSDEHLAAQDALDFVSEQLERRRAALRQVQPGIHPSIEVPNPAPLTEEERALNAAADARARAQPPHSGYIEDPTYGVDTETGLVADRPSAMGVNTAQEAADLVGGLGKGIGQAMREADLRAAEGRMQALRKEMGAEGPEFDVRLAETPLGKQIQRIRDELAGIKSPEPPPPASYGIDTETGRPVETRPTIPPAESAKVEAVLPAAEAARQPTPQESALPRRAPDPTGPRRPGEGSPVTPEDVEAARSDRQLVDEMLQRSRGRARQPVVADVQRVLNGITSAQQSLTDRRARLGALGRYIENVRGRPLEPHENAWLLSRVYEGREDAALLRMERMLQDPLTKVGREYIPDLENVAVQLDNVGVDWLARMKERSRVEATIPRVRARQQAPLGEARRTGEAALEEQRARSHMRATEREWISAMNERNALLKEMDTLGEGPTRGVETSRAARRKAARGEGSSRSMETDRSMSAQDRLERVNVRLETAKARHADARQIVDDLVAQKRDVAEARTRVRAGQRAEVVGDRRKYSGGAAPQKVDAILQSLVEDVGPQKAKDITDGLDALYRYRDAVRDRLVESGVWSKETGAEFKANHPYYIPTKILEKLDSQFLDNLPTGSRTFSSSSDLIKHITPGGTEADRMTPIRSVLEMGFQGEATARRNEIMKAVAGWADTPGMENFVRKLKASEPAPVGYKKMAAMIDGKAQSIAVHDELVHSLQMNNPGWTGILGAAVKGATFPLRAGATALRPAFIATNAVNDAGLTLFRFAAERPWYDLPNPISRARDLADLFRGYHLAMGAARPATRLAAGMFAGGTVESAREGGEGNFPWNDPDYWKKIGAAMAVGGGVGLARGLAPVDRAMIDRFRASGASMGMQSRFRNPDDLVRQLSGERILVRKLTSENDLAGWLGNRVGRASDVAGMLWSRPLGEIGSLVESAPRYAAFGRAEREARQAIGREIRDARKQGFTITPEREAELHDALLQQQMPEIANKARRVTADFAAGGSFIKTLNQISPFLNASTQALVESGDMTRKNAPGVAAATAAIVAATIYSEIYNRSVAPDDYKNVSEFTKNTGLVILSDKEPEGEGKRGLVYIPTRGIVGSLVPLTKAAMGIYFGDDPRTWKQLAIDVGIATVNQMSPVNADVSGLMGMFVPPPLSLAQQARSNYDAFRDQPIVSRSKEGLPTSEQYDDRTSQFARHLARSNLPVIGGHSPLMTDWFIKGVSPGPGEAFLSAADNVIKFTGNDLPSTTRNVPQGARDEPVFGPVIGRFLRTVGSAEQNRAYQNADEKAAADEKIWVPWLESDPSYQNATPDRQQQMMRSLRAALLDTAQTQAGVEKTPKDLGLPPKYAGIATGSQLEQDISSAMGTPIAQRTPRQQYLAETYKDRINPYWTERNKAMGAQTDRIRRAVGAGAP